MRTQTSLEHGREPPASSPQPLSHRREQLASILHRAVQNALSRGLADPRIRGLITVTEVEVTPDLREAIVSVSILPAQYQAATFQGLNAATLRLQKLVNGQISARRPPHIRFRLDERLKKQAEVLSAIRDAVADLAPTAKGAPDETRPESERIADGPGPRSADPMD